MYLARRYVTGFVCWLISFCCILWTDEQEKRSCPQCGAKVGPKGSHRVIPLFLSNLTAKDTGELETALKRLDEEKRLRKQVPLLRCMCFLFLGDSALFEVSFVPSICHRCVFISGLIFPSITTVL